MMITIKEVAELAGVSKATVSRVLNNSGYVSNDTRQKVMEIVERHYYLPSASAVNLSKQESTEIGVVVPEIDNIFYSDVLRGITDIAEEHALPLLFFDTQNSAEKEARALQILRRHRVRGLIVGPSVDYSGSGLGRELSLQLRALKIPMIILDRDSENMQWDGVFFENYRAAHRAARELFKAGNRRLGIITGNLELKIGRDRLQGFIQGAQDCGLELRDGDIHEGNFMEDRAYELTKKMLLSGDMPDAVFTSNNQTTIGFLSAANECGVRVGKDIALMGLDRVPVFEKVGVSFSCVYRDNIEMGRVALRLLLDRIKNPHGPRTVHMMPYSVLLTGSEKRTP